MKFKVMLILSEICNRCVVTEGHRRWNGHKPTRAVRRRHCVGGGAPVNFGRRRRRAPVQKSRRRRRRGGGGGAARRGRPKTAFSKIHEKISFYPQNFLRNFFSHQSFEVCR